MGWYCGWGMLLVVVGLVALGILRARGSRPAGRHTADTATEVLRRHFAAGELSRREFDQLRRAPDTAPAAPHGLPR